MSYLLVKLTHDAAVSLRAKQLQHSIPNSLHLQALLSQSKYLTCSTNRFDASTVAKSRSNKLQDSPRLDRVRAVLGADEPWQLQAADGNRLSLYL